MPNSPDAIIIGSGIIGAACAHALASQGLRATVIDPAPIASGASAASMGHIVVLDDPAPELALSLPGRRLWQALAPALPKDANFRRCGTLWIASDDAELAEAAAKHARLRAAGDQADLLDERQLHEVEPSLRSGLPGGLLVHDDAVIDPPAAAKWLLQQAGIREEDIIRRRAVKLKAGAVVLDDGSRLAAEVIINAAGLDARSLSRVPLRAKKGHLIHAQAPINLRGHQLVELGYIKSVHTHDPENVVFNLRPHLPLPSGERVGDAREGGGRVRGVQAAYTSTFTLGASREYDVEDPSINKRILDRLAARAQEFLPGLAGLTTLRAWTGFRSATPDGQPCIGPDPDHAGVYVAAGHEGLGITTALATAELLAALITRTTPAIDPAPYNPGRFQT